MDIKKIKNLDQFNFYEKQSNAIYFKDFGIRQLYINYSISVFYDSFFPCLQISWLLIFSLLKLHFLLEIYFL